MQDLCILIPTINRKDLLMEALNNYSKLMPEVPKLILDNGKQDITCVDDTTWIFESNENLGVAGSWNYLINKAILNNFKYFLILNDDVILQKDEGLIRQILSKGTKDHFYICRPFYNWSSFILTKNVYEKVGAFDEKFKKAYFEDNDYMYRMKLAGVPIKYVDELNPDVYLNSQTIEKNPLLGGYIDNKEYFLQKWGGLPESETFKTPFNK
jgi:GT2 family glycosyltransferase